MTQQEFDPRATSMGDEVSAEVYEELFAMRRSIDNFDAALVHIRGLGDVYKRQS